MGTITVNASVSLDGVMQSPARANEDVRGGFRHGGWANGYQDPVAAEAAGRAMAAAAESALLFGRRTYEDFYAVWPNRPEPNPFTEVLNRKQKYVASTTLSEPMPWMNSTLLSGPAAESVARFKREGEQDLVVLGSGALVRSLISARLVDRFVLSIHPLVLGAGQQLFDGDLPLHRLSLVESIPTTTGVIIATYDMTERAAPDA